MKGLSHPTTEESLAPYYWNARHLAKAIFQAEAPEQFVRTLPAQTLFWILLENGLDSSADLLEIVTDEQFRLLLDFDCWNVDRFDEDRFWEWLAVTDSTNSLRILQKLLKTVDLKLVSLCLSRHLEVLINEERTETPPGPGWYTPDRGVTWLRATVEDERKVFLLNRFLALIFETSTELFYQLLSIPNVSTQSSLEEESFGDRNRRLSAEGFPDPEVFAEVTAPLSIPQVKLLLRDQPLPTVVQDIAVVAPMLYESPMLEPLRSLCAALGWKEELECELTFLLNCALARFNVPMNQFGELKNFIAQMKGVLNVGLELCLELSTRPSTELYAQLGLRRFFGAGLGVLTELRKLSARAPLLLSPVEPHLIALREQLQKPVPCYPRFLCSAMKEPSAKSAASVAQKLEPHPEAFEHLSEVRWVERFLNQPTPDQK